MMVRNTELEFPEKGVVLVTGHNEASKGAMESNGSGKTSLGEALCRTLVGVNGRYSSLGHYSQHDKGNMYVKLEAELKGQPLVVELGHKCKELSKTGEGLRFQYGEQEPVQRGHIQETRQEIISALGITPNLANWAVYIDGDKLNFNRMSERETVGLLMTALRQPSWDDIQKKTSRLTTDAKTTQKTLASKLDYLKQQRTNNANMIEDAKADLADEKERVKKEGEELQDKIALEEEAIADKERRAVRLEARQILIKKECKRIDEECAVSQGKLEKEIVALQSDENTLLSTLSKLMDKRSNAQSKKMAERKVLNEMLDVPTTCPTCNKPWDQAHGEAEIKTQRSKVTKAEAALVAADKKKTDVDGKIQVIRQQISVINSKIRALKRPKEAQDLSYEYEDNEGALRNISKEVADRRVRIQSLKQGPDRANLERYAAILDERKAKTTEIKTDLEKTASELVEAEMLVKVLGYWVEAFGPTGVPNLILADAVKPLNDIARRISSLMTGGTIEIVYDTSRTLVSGKTSQELVVNVHNKIGATRIAGSSKGEGGLINLIIAETLSEVGMVSNRVGFRWYDEITNGKDPVVRKNILAYLREMANRLGILIFIVDHHAEAASYADYVLVAEKTDSGTRYFWKD
jgi:DNA repair exonuclease SbcCD ATPase subunit